MNNYNDVGTDAATLLLTGVLLIPILIIAFAGYIIGALTIQSILKRQGHPTPGLAWIPIYNQYLLLRAGGQPEWMLWVVLGTVVMSIIPVLNFLAWIPAIFLIIVTVFAILNLARGFGMENIQVLLVILSILPLMFITYLIFLFNRSPWNQAAADQAPKMFKN